MVEENLPAVISKSVVFLKRAFYEIQFIRSLSNSFKDDVYEMIEDGKRIERDIKFPKTDDTSFLVKLFKYVDDFEKMVKKLRDNTSLGVDDLLVEITGELNRTITNTYRLEYIKPINKIGKPVQDLVSLLQSKPPNN